eukprot:CAMPEP_0175007712 /NCGR_PEP_ID=MMETSP0005-20121125/6576_1 /TAXON_ID=420556 /ORGANISM="Ochromonas sp., Strain CCMP1393" /LENGTH=248 /DNA_ID=CAMNT_0016263209 /DNA_START=126 /DNA_END=872 /DNA_ORIENTATION=-
MTSDGLSRGVNFSSNPENLSPHITQTHCESSLHVYCREIGTSLMDILHEKKELREPLSACFIRVVPILAEGCTVHRHCDGICELRMGSDKYSLGFSSDQDVQGQLFTSDRVVTKEILINAFAALDFHAHFGTKKEATNVLLIDIVGEEDCMSNWAYLTNDAVKYIVEEIGFQVVILNTASIDRENDGGMVPNHKIVFSARCNLVVELAKLSHLERAGTGTVMLNIQPHDTYSDCGQCLLEFAAHPLSL